MDMFWNMKSNSLVLVYCCFLLGGVVSKGQQPMDLHNLPKFLPTNNNFTFRVGQMAILECNIENLDGRRVIWRIASDPTPLTVGTMPFNEDPRYAVQHEDGSTKWNLIIHDVQMKDAGVYECQISSRMRHLRHHVTLMVVEPSTTPRPNIQISGSNYVDEGDRIYLMCNATSEEYPPEDIDWFKAGSTLATDEHRGMLIHKFVSLNSGTIYSSLEIKHARLSDAGVYVCRTSNKDVTSIHVSVLNGDTFNVKRGTVKKDSTAASQDSSLGGNDSGSRIHYTLTSLLVSMVTSYVCSQYTSTLGLT